MLHRIPGGVRGDALLMCKSCLAQIGLRTAYRSHDRLGSPGAPGTAGYKATANQKLYLCSDCKSVLVKGRNTGWSAATLIVAQSAVPA